MIIRSLGLASACLFVLVGEATSTSLGPGSGTAANPDSVLRTVRIVALQEPADNPIGEITDFDVLPDGRFLVLDGMSVALRLHDENGFLEKTVGRRGSGPGEFRRPGSLTVNTAGQVFVTDHSSNRITRFTPDLEYDTTFALPGQVVFEVKAAGDRILVGSYRRFEDAILIIDFDGRILGSFHPFEPETFSVPYWEAITAPFLGIGNDSYFVATTTLYPIRRYALDGTKLPDFGTPPMSWIEPVRPKYGAFVGLNRDERLNSWVKSFSIISGIDVYRNEMVLVTHGGLEWVPQQRFKVHQRTMDIYEPSGTKVVEDVPVPGRVLSVGGHVVFLTSEPPGPWLLRICQLRLSKP